jgi:hypothetical protein
MWQVPYNGLKCEKGGADVYLDDKALTDADDGWKLKVDDMVKDSE